jgi:hypothetical protein
MGEYYAVYQSGAELLGVGVTMGAFKQTYRNRNRPQ